MAYNRQVSFQTVLYSRQSFHTFRNSTAQSFRQLVGRHAPLFQTSHSLLEVTHNNQIDVSPIWRPTWQEPKGCVLASGPFTPRVTLL